MITYIAVGVAGLVVVLLVIAALQPTDFRIARSAAITAPPAAIFPQVNELRKWESWSPWAKMDPNVRNTYAGPEAGPGAAFAWAGNNKIGEGRMTIIESQPGALIRIKLEFFKPFQATNTVEFTFKPEADKTVVTWAMSGQRNFLMKFMGLFLSCDKMIGCHYEKGLAGLARVSMAGPRPAAAAV